MTNKEYVKAIHKLIKKTNDKKLLHYIYELLKSCV